MISEIPFSNNPWGELPQNCVLSLRQMQEWGPKLTMIILNNHVNGLASIFITTRENLEIEAFHEVACGEPFKIIDGKIKTERRPLCRD